jgi:hypothetical protein
MTPGLFSTARANNAARGIARIGPQRVHHIHLALCQQARTQLAVGGQAEPVARGTKVLAHRGNKAKRPFCMGETKHARRPIARHGR